MIVARHEGAALADEKIEVGAFARLQHVIEVQLPVAALERRRGQLPVLSSLEENVFRHQEHQPALFDVQLDHVAVLDQRERAARRSFGDRKSTRLNSSHLVISYAVFCLKKKKNQ